jgi:hypothetical protein
MSAASPTLNTTCDSFQTEKHSSMINKTFRPWKISYTRPLNNNVTWMTLEEGYKIGLRSCLDLLATTRLKKQNKGPKSVTARVVKRKESKKRGVLVRRRNTSKSKRQRRRTEGRLGDRVWDVIN